jgi:alpha-mannosidase
VIERGVNTEQLYEAPAQRWVDISDNTGGFGVSVFSDSRYGWDRPDKRTMRLTLLHTPGEACPEFRMQEELDIGRHRCGYAIHGHTGTWRDAAVWRQAAAYDQPLTAVQVPSVKGGSHRSCGLVESRHAGIALCALKLAEEGTEWVVRFNEKSGRAVKGAKVQFPAPVESIRELDGQERHLRNLPCSKGRELSLDFGPFEMRTLAVTIAPPSTTLSPYAQRRVGITHNLQVVSRDGMQADGPGFDRGCFIPAEHAPSRIFDGAAHYAFLNNVGLGAPEAMACRGQTVSLGKKPVSKASLWILGAADGTDAIARFKIGGQLVEVPFQRGGGFIAQWDRRSHPAYQNSCVPGMATVAFDPCDAYCKQGRIAFVVSHRHDPAGKNSSWDPCYLFSHRIPLPNGIREVTVPDDPRILVFSMVVIEDGGGETPRASLDNPFSHRRPDRVG